MNSRGLISSNADLTKAGKIVADIRLSIAELKQHNKIKL